MHGFAQFYPQELWRTFLDFAEFERGIDLNQ